MDASSIKRWGSRYERILLLFAHSEDDVGHILHKKILVLAFSTLLKKKTLSSAPWGKASRQTTPDFMWR